MKKKTFKTFPYLLLFAVCMTLCAVAASFFSLTLFIIIGVIALVSIGVAVFIYIRFDRYVQLTIRGMIASTKGVDKNYLERFGFPVAVLGSDADFVWHNSAFLREVSAGKNLYGVSLSRLVKGRSAEEICGSEGADIEIGEKKFSVYANPIDTGFVLYFFDDTYLKNTEKEYKDSRLSVAIVALDNIEAFEDEDDEDEGLKIILQVENLLQRLAVDCNSLYRKIGHGKYMLLLEERELQKLIENKFSILNKVREIPTGDLVATLSIGIGRGEGSLRRSQTSAKRALDMALGRGGDQVAILKGGEFSFFGGKSAGVEKNSKVRARVIAGSLMNAVEESDRVIVMGHRFSDLDCIGSAIGLQSAITASFKKKVYIAVNYEDSMAKSLIDAYKAHCGEGVFVEPSTARELITPRTLLIVVDTQSVGRLEAPELYTMAKRVIVIDHHRMSVDHLENTLIFYHESSASSASEMCVELISSFPEDNLKKPAAEALMAGIILDTKNFVINSGARTFEAAAYLKKHGADTVSVRQLFSDSIEIYRNKYKLVSTARIYKKCAIVIADENMADIRLIASKAADELLGLKGVNASFVVYKTEDSVINVSARSYGKRNVQIIMEKLGGGGHHAMAAAQLRGITFENAVRQLIDAIDGDTP